MGRVLIIILVGLLPLRALGDCTNDPAQIKLALPPAALSIRNALFSKLCAMPGAELVDVTDKTLGQRLEPPSKPKLPDRSLDLNSGLPLPNGLRGTVLLAFLVDVDGSLRETTVIQSSGNPLIDEAALNWWRYAKYKSPAKLDGRTVRALTYWKMPINTTGRDLYRPGHLPGGR